MAMGNFHSTDSSNGNNNNNHSNLANQRSKVFQGEIISCYRKYFHNNDANSCFMHGMLKYMGDIGSIETIEFCTKQSNLNVGDTVSFNFSADKSASNPYANNVIKPDFNQEIKEEKQDKINKYPVRLICISDTHNSHEKLTRELCDIYKSESDILVHCGDMTDNGSKRELKEVNKWFATLPYKHIIITAGNMDGIGLDKNKYNSRYGGGYSNDCFASSIFTNAIYLEHESYYLKEYNLRFFASPYSLKFVGGFQINNDREAELKWKEIPNNTDILICHGPPANILDLTSRGKHTGDKILFKHVINRIKPKVMLFGHMHSSFGYQKYKGIHFYNCALNNALNQGGGYHGYSSYYNSNTKINNMKNEKPHIINLSNLS